MIKFADNGSLLTDFTVPSDHSLAIDCQVSQSNGSEGALWMS